MEYKNKNPQKKAKEITEAFVDASSLKTDPQGSYTGKYIDAKEAPVQDVDDL